MMYCVSLLYFIIIVRLHKLKTLRLLAQSSYYFAVHTHKIPIFNHNKLLNTDIVDISLSQVMPSTISVIISSQVVNTTTGNVCGELLAQQE